jgi:hypothetical protein
MFRPDINLLQAITCISLKLLISGSRFAVHVKFRVNSLTLRQSLLSTSVFLVIIIVLVIHTHIRRSSNNATSSVYGALSNDQIIKKTDIFSTFYRQVTIKFVSLNEKLRGSTQKRALNKYE